MITKQNRFIVFLSLSFIFIALLARSSLLQLDAKTLIKNIPLLNRRAESLTSSSDEQWPISYDQALTIVKKEKEVKEFLERGQVVKRDDFGTTISQPKINWEDLPTKEKPFWELHVFEEVINIPKDQAQAPTSQIATLNWYRVDARTGRLEKSF
jgi:hypothetical protein